MANSIPHVANVTRETIDVSVHGNMAKSNGKSASYRSMRYVPTTTHSPVVSSGYLQTYPLKVSKWPPIAAGAIEDRQLP